MTERLTAEQKFRRYVEREQRGLKNGASYRRLLDALVLETAERVRLIQASLDRKEREEDDCYF